MIIAMVLLGTLLLLGTAAAETEEGNATMKPLESHAIELENTGASMDVTYDVTVTEGGAILVFVMDEPNYKKFMEDDPNAQYYIDFSVEAGTKNAKKEFTWEESGKFYIIIFNNAMIDDTSVDYTVTSEVMAYDMMMIVGIVIVVVLVIVVVAVVAMRRKKKAAEAPTTMDPGEPGAE